MKMKLSKLTLPALLLLVASSAGYAQKLPDVQPNSVYAPAGIRADGKDIEWKDSFQALNKRTNIYYTIANDDNNLYVAIKSTDGANNTKIMAGGITLSINPDGKKKEKESITLTYPVINRTNMRTGGGQGGGGRRTMMMGTMVGAAGGGQQMSKLQRDSMMAEMQKKQLAQVKEIKISGFKNTTDTLISIYNEYSIKAVANITKDNAFFYEIAIPLTALGMTKDSSTEFAYNIKLNGLQIQGFDGGGGGGGGPRGGGGNFGPRGGGNSNFDFQALISPTDFWGKYILAKK